MARLRNASSRPVPASAPRKRLRSASVTRSRLPKKQKTSTASGWYTARAILDETATHYQIDWDGIDPATGAPFEPTWEPKRNANALLVQAWRAATTRRRAGGRAQAKSATDNKAHGTDNEERRAGKQPGRDTEERESGEEESQTDEEERPLAADSREPDADCFPARAIVGERKNRYRVAWEKDPTTGEQSPDTWVPKRNVSRDLVDAWREEKRRKRAQKRERKLQRQEQKRKQSATTTEPVTPHNADEDWEDGEEESAVYDEDTPDVVVGFGLIRNGASGSTGGRRNKAGTSGDASAFGAASSMTDPSPFWSPTVRRHSKTPVQYGFKKRLPLLLGW